MLKNDLISVVIPAYNNPEYTSKTLNSLLDQSHRPIEIILSDDNSPDSLYSIVENFKKKIDEDIIIKFFRQNKNLGYFYNLCFCLSQVKGNFLVMIDHDDWLIDSEYFQEAILQIKKNQTCVCSFANTFFENVPGTYLNFYFNNWNYINGKHFLKYHLYKNINPCKSTIIFDLNKLRECKFLDYLPSPDIITNKKNIPDEGYLLLGLLLPFGDISITGKSVSVRGLPLTSLTKKNEWIKYGNNRHFVPLYNLYLYYKKIKYIEGSLVILINLLFKFPFKGYSFEIYKYFKNDKEIIFFMIFTTFYSFFLCILKLPKNILVFLKNLIFKFFRKRLIHD